MFRWNFIKVTGDRNIIFQDSNGQICEVVIQNIIAQFVEQKDKQIELLEKLLYDKEKMQGYSEERIASLQSDLGRVIQEKQILEERIAILLNGLDGKDISSHSSYYKLSLEYFIAGDLHKAVETLNRANLESRLQQVKEAEETLRSNKEQLAEEFALKAQMLALQFNYIEAFSNFESAISLNPQKSNFLTDYGIARYHSGDLEGALSKLKEAMEMDENISADDKMLLANRYLNYSMILSETGDDNKALLFISKAKDIWDADPGDDYLKISILDQLGKVLGHCHDWETALAVDLDALSLGEQLDITPKQRSVLHNNVGACYFELSRYEEALSYFNTSLKILKQLNLSEQEIGGNIFYNLGAVRSGMGESREAVELMQKAIDIDLPILGKNHFQLAKYYQGIGVELISTDKSSALRYLYMAIDIRASAFAHDHPDLAETYAAVAVAIQKAEPHLSVDFFRKAIGIREKRFDNYDPQLAKWYAYLATSYGFSTNLQRSILCDEAAWLRLQYAAPKNDLLISLIEKGLKDQNINFSMLTAGYTGFMNAEGTYSYNCETDDQNKNKFVCFIRFKEVNVIEGTALEFNVQLQRSMIARLNGHLIGDRIEFTKTYLTFAGIQEYGLKHDASLLPIHYSGLFFARESCFAGKWEIKSSTGGQMQLGLWQMASVT